MALTGADFNTSLAQVFKDPTAFLNPAIQLESPTFGKPLLIANNAQERFSLLFTPSHASPIVVGESNSIQINVEKKDSDFPKKVDVNIRIGVIPLNVRRLTISLLNSGLIVPNEFVLEANEKGFKIDLSINNEQKAEFKIEVFSKADGFKNGLTTYTVIPTSNRPGTPTKSEPVPSQTEDNPTGKTPKENNSNKPDKSTDAGGEGSDADKAPAGAKAPDTAPIAQKEADKLASEFKKTLTLVNQFKQKNTLSNPPELAEKFNENDLFFRIIYETTEGVFKTLNFALLPAKETKLGGGWNVPDVKMGLPLQAKMKHKIQTIPGSGPVVQTVGIAGTTFNLIGGVLGLEFIGDFSTEPYKQSLKTFEASNKKINNKKTNSKQKLPNPDLAQPALYRTFGQGDKFDSAYQVLYKILEEIVYPGRPVIIEMNPAANGGSLRLDPKVKNKQNSLFRYTVIVQSAKFLFALADRCYYNLEVFITQYPNNVIQPKSFYNFETGEGAGSDENDGTSDQAEAKEESKPDATANTKPEVKPADLQKNTEGSTGKSETSEKPEAKPADNPTPKVADTKDSLEEKLTTLLKTAASTPDDQTFSDAVQDYVDNLSKAEKLGTKKSNKADSFIDAIFARENSVQAITNIINVNTKTKSNLIQLANWAKGLYAISPSTVYFTIRSTNPSKDRVEELLKLFNNDIFNGDGQRYFDSINSYLTNGVW